MPIIRVELFAGRTQQQKNEFVVEVTRVAAETLKCPADAVDVIFSEVAPLGLASWWAAVHNQTRLKAMIRLLS